MSETCVLFHWINSKKINFVARTTKFGFMHQNDSNICFCWVRDIGTRKEQHGNTATPLEGLIKCIVLFHHQVIKKIRENVYNLSKWLLCIMLIDLPFDKSIACSTVVLNFYILAWSSLPNIVVQAPTNSPGNCLSALSLGENSSLQKLIYF